MIEITITAPNGEPADLDVTLDGDAYTLRLRRNARADGWAIDILDADGTVVAASLSLRSGWACQGQIRARPGIPPGLLIVVSADLADPSVDDLGGSARLIYVTAAEAVTFTPTPTAAA